MNVSLIITIITIFIFFLELSSCSSSVESFIYVGCTQLKYNPGTSYESSVNSVLASLVNSASISNYNHFQSDAVSALYQCRGDLSSSDCRSCVASAVSRLGSFCVGTSGGALQLDGCFIKYDNTSFVGAQDKTVVSSKCGGYDDGGDEDVGSRRDAVLAYLTGQGQGQYFRVGGSGKVQGMVQCVQDLSAEECEDCLSEAVQRLKTDCAASSWADMFLGKCYARYSHSQLSAGGYTPASKTERDDNDETEKTLALIIGLIAAVTLLIIFLSFLSKSLDREDGK
ncbi:plasmodesmata-located protein 6 [Perilla frutescens var. frutescens]|nr:plasmodesmata-located protein 6 [Perilla frutescens var. frutescens]